MIYMNGQLIMNLPDSPSVARPYCPTCEPDVDSTQEILDIRWCESHTPERTGSEDSVVSTPVYLSGSSEAGGDDNRRWCELLHKDRKKSENSDANY
jgi:hypothetical protein